MQVQPFATLRDYVLLIILTIVLAQRQVYAIDQISLSSKCDQLDVIAEALHAKGQTRVIIELSMNSSVARTNPAPQVLPLLEHKTRIRKLQDRFISKHFGKVNALNNKSSYLQMRRFEISAMLAVTVNEDELTNIANDQDVIAIHPDHVDFPSLQESVPLIGMTGPLGAYAMGASGNGQAVAILDSGIQAEHPFLIGQVISEACFSSPGFGSSSLCPNGEKTQTGPGAASATTPACLNETENICTHGTHVAGIVAGNNTEPGIPTGGVAKTAKIIAVQVFSRFEDPNICGIALPCVGSYTSDQIAGLEWIYQTVSTLPQDAKLAAVNMSLGGGKYLTYCDSDARKPYIDALRSVGVATAIASGNNGYADAVNAPGCISTAVTVGATSKQDNLARYSNQSYMVDLLAPGTDIYSSIPSSLFEYKSGTSMATPHVAASFAAIRSRYADASVDAIENALESTGIPIANSILNPSVKPRIQVNSALNSLTKYLTVSRNEGGTITSTPQAIDCGRLCTTALLRDSLISLQAIPGAGYRFVGWSGDCAENDICNLRMDSDKNVSAKFFELPKYLLSVRVNNSAGGSVISRPEGIDCGKNCASNFIISSRVSLQPIANTGHRFDGWSGDCSGLNDCVLIMEDDRSVKANFRELPKYLLSVARSNKGTVTSLPSGIECGAPGKLCRGLFSDVTLTAVANYGYIFKNWTGCAGTPTLPKCMITLDNRSRVKANYDRLPRFALTVIKTPFGSISSTPSGLLCKASVKSCSGTFPKGASVILSAQPVEGKTLVKWEGDCSGTDTTCTVLLDRNKTISAVFQ